MPSDSKTEQPRVNKQASDSSPSDGVSWTGYRTKEMLVLTAFDALSGVVGDTVFSRAQTLSRPTS